MSSESTSPEVAGCLHCSLPVPAARRAAAPPWFCCFGCRFAYGLAQPAGSVEGGGEEGGSPSTLLLRLGLGIFLTLNVMGASWLSYSRDLLGEGAVAGAASSPLLSLANYLALLLTTIVVALLGVPLLADSARTLFAPLYRAAGGRPWDLLRGLGARFNAQLLIVIGVTSAYLLSVVHTVRGQGSLYFDTAAALLVVMTLGSHLEAGARRRASASSARLLAELPSRARVERGGALLEIPLAEVRPGDRVSVSPGEMIPVDGRILDGESRVDESSLTGESRPRAVEPGARVLAGSQNHEGQLWVSARKIAEETVLALMERSLEEARRRRPPIQRLADRVAAVFVPAVVLLAAGLFVMEAWQGEPEAGLLSALAVLLISCPCALGLAAPLASWHGLRRAAEQGILIDSPATLERAAKVRDLYLDKTGTLTRPTPSLERIITARGISEAWAVEAAASLEAASTHPIGRALLESARARGVEPRPIMAARNVSGLGIEGRLADRSLRLGSRRWIERLGISEDLAALSPSLDAAEADGIFLMEGDRVLARFELDETLRDDAAGMIADLRARGIRTAILSGDRASATRRLAGRLGIEGEGALLPGEKVERLRARRRLSGGCVAMLGDGINDSPVLAGADLGIAVGSASDLARRSGNVRLVSDRLDRVPLLFLIARDVHRRIRWNLLFAFGFNTVGIALAVSGFLTPVFAALAMIASSLAVVTISARAGRTPSETDASAASGGQAGGGRESEVELGGQPQESPL